ncbi:hypothetical protein GCM10010406_32450 [Streptomyces thermolineatus]|uniref:UspA domain-containing protein n=1 Tax=Streptomyces thermolineatus TaxID=44033 RepID=A0ABN3M1P4_9ACTN
MDKNQGVIVGIDGSDSSWIALDWAYREAARRRTRLRVLHVRGIAHPLQHWLRRRSAAAPPGSDRVLEEVDGHLPELADAPASVEKSAPAAKLSTLSPAPDLVEYSKDAELLVLGAVGSSGTREHLFGSTARRCAASSACPTVIVREKPHEVRRALVGIDGSPDEIDVLRWGFHEADRHRAELHVVHVVWPWEWPPYSEPEMAQAARQMLKFNVERLPPSPSGRGVSVVAEVVRHEHPVQGLLDKARNADLLVCGSVGTSSGSVSDSLVHAAARYSYRAEEAGLESVAGHAAHLFPSHVVVLPTAPGPSFPWEWEELVEEERDWNRQQSASELDDVMRFELP